MAVAAGAAVAATAATAALCRTSCRDRGANGANGAKTGRTANGANGKKRRAPGEHTTLQGHKRGKGAAKRERAAHGAREPSAAQDEGDGEGDGTQ